MTRGASGHFVRCTVVIVVASRPGAIRSFAYVLGVYLGDGAVTLWRMAGKADRLVFRLNTIDEDFANATRAALADLSDYKVSLSCHPVPKSSNPNWALALGYSPIHALVGSGSV